VVNALFRTVCWIGFVYLSCIVIENSWGIVVARDEVPFLQERLDLAGTPLWRSALALHAAAGALCLVASFLQFFRPIVKHRPALHRWLGRIYTWSILGVLCPTGFHLSLYAKGGAAGAAGFIVLGIFTFHSTWQGWITIRRGQTRDHVKWMIRSFAMVTTAITFRIYNIFLTEIGMHYQTVYLVALYLSLIGNAVAAEWLIGRIHPSKSIETQKNNEHEIQPYPKSPAALSGNPVHQRVRPGTRA
tara:strand:- start:1059 stop:1793 length:735 start_codon:yes stop_codon:yes gene_type:complete